MKYLVAMASIAISIFVGVYVYQYALEQSQITGPAPVPQPVAVETTLPRKRAVEDRTSLVGVLEAGAQIQILAKSSGYITELPYDVGDMVQAGEIIAKLDDSQQRENVATAKAALTIAEAQLRAKKAEVDLAEKVVERERELAQAKATSMQQLEAYEGQLLVNKAQYDLESARVSEALSRLEQSQLLLKETIITAPTTGVVAERFVDIGSLAKNDVPLMRIVTIDSVRTLVHVVEHDYPKITVGQSARVETDAFPGQSFYGQIARKAPVIDPQTSTAAVQIEIPNHDRLLKPGMHMRVSILFQRRENVTVVPTSALLENQRFPAVMVVHGDPPTAELREVEVGVNNGEIVEITSGLQPEDRVITLGSRIITAGQEVNPQHVAWPAELLAREGAAVEQSANEPIAAE